MTKLRNLLIMAAVLLALVMTMAPVTSARPAQQDTPTPEATMVGIETPPPEMMETSEAPGIAPGVSPLGTPGILPETGETVEDGSGTTTLIILAIVVVIVAAIIAMAVSRRGPSTQ